MFKSTGVVFESALQIPDPGRRVIRDRRGRFYAANAAGQPEVIAVWDSTGKPMGSVGGSGEAPGEFNTRGALTIFLDAANRLYVRDGASVWSIFSEDLQLIERFHRPGSGCLPSSTILLDDNRVLTGDATRPTASHFFHITDIRTGLCESFGVASGSTGQPQGRRRIAYAGGDSFWTAAPALDTQGYELELWSITGRVVRSIRRNLDLQASASPAGQPPAHISLLHLDDQDRLIVYVSTPNARWRPFKGPQITRALRDTFFDLVFDVLDAKTGVLLSSQRMNGAEARERLPRAFFTGTSLAYRLSTAGGTPAIEIVTYHLR